MRVAVTGAAGLLGRYVCRRLLDRGDTVMAIDNLSRFKMFAEDRRQLWPPELRHERCMRVEDSFFSDDVLNLIREDCPDAIVHAAAQTSHPRSIDVPILDHEINVIGTLKLLELLRDEDRWRGVKRPRLAFISSAKLYGENVAPAAWLRTTDRRIDLSISVTADDGRIGFDLINDESMPDWQVGVNERCPVGDQTQLTPFGISKAAADLYVQVYSKLYGIDGVCLRPGCFTGPGSLATEQQNWEPRLVGAMVRGEPFPVYGWKGRQVRDVLHADDLARAVLCCLDRQANFRGDVYNLSGGPRNSVSILEAVELIKEICNRTGSLEHHPQREGDWPVFIGSNRKFTREFGWQPEIDVRTTFKQLCDEAIQA